MPQLLATAISSAGINRIGKREIDHKVRQGIPGPASRISNTQCFAKRPAGRVLVRA